MFVDASAVQNGNKKVHDWGIGGVHLTGSSISILFVAEVYPYSATQQSFSSCSMIQRRMHAPQCRAANQDTPYSGGDIFDVSVGNIIDAQAPAPQLPTFRQRTPLSAVTSQSSPTHKLAIGMERKRTPAEPDAIYGARSSTSDALRHTCCTGGVQNIQEISFVVSGGARAELCTGKCITVSRVSSFARSNRSLSLFQQGPKRSTRWNSLVHRVASIIICTV